MSVVQKLADWGQRQAAKYAQGHQRPISGYLSAMGVYGAGVATLVAVARRRDVRLPEDISPWDVALFGVATHKLSRTLAKDAVTSPLRAPFTAFEGRQAPAELAEEPRKESAAQHAVGELITCPFCLAQWVATGFVAGSVFAPRATKLAAGTFASVAVSDFLQFVYAKLQQEE
jgi:uncharacterized protein DUF1360